MGMIQALGRVGCPGLEAVLAALAGDGARHVRGAGECRQQYLVGIGEAGLLAGDRAHTHALLDAVGAVLDDAVLE